MQICQFKEIDAQAKALQQSWIQNRIDVLGKEAHEAEMAHYVSLYGPHEADKCDCCQYYDTAKGLPGEELCVCNHPQHKHVICCN